MLAPHLSRQSSIWLTSPTDQRSDTLSLCVCFVKQHVVLRDTDEVLMLSLALLANTRVANTKAT